MRQDCINGTFSSRPYRHPSPFARSANKLRHKATRARGLSAGSYEFISIDHRSITVVSVIPMVVMMVMAVVSSPMRIVVWERIGVIVIVRPTPIIAAVITPIAVISLVVEATASVTVCRGVIPVGWADADVQADSLSRHRGRRRQRTSHDSSRDGRSKHDEFSLLFCKFVETK